MSDYLTPPALKPPSPTQVMISPDGQTGDVPVENVQAALAKGFKIGHEMSSPDGKTGVIPVDQAEKAVKAGFRPTGTLSAPKPGDDTDSTFVAGHPYGGSGGYVSGPHDQIQAIRDTQNQMAKTGMVVAGSTLAAPALAAIAPELAAAPTAAGVAARVAATGIGTAVGNSAGQAVTGQNPFTLDNMTESGKAGLISAALAAPLESLGAVSATKLGRASVNQSMGATARDVTYGNPAVAISDENIISPWTGDIEKYKQALRETGSVAKAQEAAGGRIAAVGEKITAYQPQLDAILKASDAKIPVGGVIDGPIDEASLSILKNNAMTPTEKINAIHDLRELQVSLKEGSEGKDFLTPIQANKLKTDIGDKINWSGTSAIRDDVKQTYKALYGSLKDAVNKAVPGSRQLNEKLTNLYAASADVMRQAKAEEVGRGAGPMGGKIGTTIMGRIESWAGRYLPGLSKTSPSFKPLMSALAAHFSEDPNAGQDTSDGTVGSLTHVYNPNNKTIRPVRP